MKKIYFVFIALSASFICLKTSEAQISRQSAIDTIINHILVNDTGKVDIYARYDLLNRDDTVFQRDGLYIVNSYTNSWVFFIDDHPMANWFHGCRYLLMNETDGAYQVLDKSIFPEPWLEDFELVHSMALPVPPEVINPPGDPVESLPPNPYLHAVIICGDEGTHPTFKRYWRNTSYIFTTLKEKGFTDENIVVHYNNGSSNFFGSDFDNDGIDDIDYPAFKDPIESTFKAYAGQQGGNPAIPQLQPYDHLFIFTTNHGDLNNGNASIRILHELSPPGLDHLYDYELAALLEDINCAHMAIVMSQCHSGGFIDDVMDYTNYNPLCRNRVINTACKTEESSYFEYWRTNKMYDEFILYWTAAANNFFPLNWGEPWEQGDPIELFDFLEYFGSHPMYYYPDVNGDKILQLYEVHEYADNFDCYSEYGFLKNDLGGYNVVETPQRAVYPVTDVNTIFDRILALEGVKGWITGEFDFTFEGSCLITGDLIVKETANLNILDNTQVYLFGDIEILIDEGSSLIIGNNVSFTSLSGNNSIKVHGNIAIGSDVSFVGNEQSPLLLEINNYSLNLTFENTIFEKATLINYAHSLSITNSNFNDLYRVLSHRGIINISNSVFTSNSVQSLLLLENIEDNQNTATVSGCNFTTNISKVAIDLWNYNLYNVEYNTIDGYYNGIHIMQSGYGDSKKNLINDNTISNCTQSGILAYATRGSVYKNHISNNLYGIWFGDHSSMRLYGYSGAQTNEQTQEIRDNDSYEVYASQYSFPIYFRYNVIIDDDNGGAPDDPLIYHSDNNMTLKDVRYNCWEEIAGSFVAAEDLYPGGYIWEPTWCPGSGDNSMPDSDEDMFEVANNLFNAEDYTGAKSMYEMLIEQYPQSKYAKAAMQELFALEKFVSNDYSGLKQYYENNTVPELSETGDYMVSKCDIKLENWPDAISYYENIILDPETMEDSIFAIIDLGYVYFVMENSGYKSAYTGNLIQYKPESKEQFIENRNYLLSLIPGDQMSETMKGNIAGLKEGELLQNVPNPFKGSTQIWYKFTSVP
ncbi:MAG: hypothetical protein K8S16_05000 [Bacteroidales bacterium]|nr:hypothetical protein [Bacteroidales bacterium]